MSYKATVSVYDEEIYVDTESGIGFKEIFKKIDPLINKFAKRTFISGYDFEDVKQEICLIALDGIRAYSPDKEVKLSTFLHIHIRNKIISKIRSVNKMSNDATTIIDDDSSDGKEPIASREVNFSEIKILGDDGSTINFEDTVCDSDDINYQRSNSLENLEFENLLASLSNRVDQNTIDLLRYICLFGYNVKEAADKVGITGWAASMKIKKLNRNPRIKKYLGKPLYDK